MQGGDLRDWLITVEDHDRFAMADLIEVPGEVVLELGYPGSFHLAIIPMRNPVNNRHRDPGMSGAMRAANKRGPGSRDPSPRADYSVSLLAGVWADVADAGAAVEVRRAESAGRTATAARIER